MKFRIIMIALLLIVLITGCGQNKSADQLLYEGTKEVNKAWCQEALDMGAGIDSATSDFGKQMRPLENAIEAENWAFAMWLLEQGASPSEMKGYNPINGASQKGSIYMVKALVSKGGAINLTTLKDYLSGGGQDLDMVLFLMDQGAVVTQELWDTFSNVHIFTKDPEFPYSVNQLLLGYLLKVGGKSGVDPLLEQVILGDHLALLNKDQIIQASLAIRSEVLCYTVAHGDLDLLKNLKNNGWNLSVIDGGGNNLLHLAAKYNQVEMVSYLIEEQISLNTLNDQGETPLIMAIQSGNTNMTSIFLKRGAELLWKGDISSVDTNVNELKASIFVDDSNMLTIIEGYTTKYNSALIQALLNLTAIYNAPEVTQYLITRQADVNMIGSDNRVPIELAARYGSMEVMEVLISQGAFIEFDYTIAPLYEAVCSDQETVVKYLLDKGASPDMTTTNMSPLWKAMTFGNMTIIEALLNAGADVHKTRSTEEQSYMHLAVNMGSSWMINQLMTAGAIVDVQDHKGRTPLMYAIENNSLNIISTLLLYKPDIYLVNDNGESALEMVEDQDDKSLSALFHDYQNQ